MSANGNAALSGQSNDVRGLGQSARFGKKTYGTLERSKYVVFKWELERKI